MDVAVQEEPQKKVFRARKTMKPSDRQQLESLHNILPSSDSCSSSIPAPVPINKTHSGEGQLEAGNNKENEEALTSNSQKVTCAVSSVSSECSALPELSPSISGPLAAKAPSPPPVSPSLNPVMKGAENKKNHEGKGKFPQMDRGDKVKESWTERKKNAALPMKEEAYHKLDPNKIQHDSRNVSLEIFGTTDKGDKKTISEDTYDGTRDPLNSIPKDEAPTLGKTDVSSLPESPLAPVNATPSSPSLSPFNTLESDQEVKEGFLVLSDEDDSQGDREEEKGTDGEMMTVDDKGGEQEVQAATVSHSTLNELCSTTKTGTKEGSDCMTSTKKRAASSEGISEEERLRKRPRVEKGELKAQLELKISGDASIRQRLEKVVQHLVAEHLRILQLTVFDKSLQELRERVEKIDCATKHQQTLNMLQAKIARLSKKFGAANQAKENLGKPKEVSTLSSAPAVPTATPTSNTTLTCRTVKALLESQRAEQHCQGSTLSPVSSTGSPNQRKPVPVLTTPSAPVPATGSLSSASTTSLSLTNANPPVSQSGTVMLKAATAGTGLTPGTPMSASAPVSLQPLLIQLPLAMSNPQVGHTPGVELIPVSSLAGTATYSKTKTTTPSTAFILQKSIGTTANSASALPPPPAPSLPQITIARGAMPSGGSGIISVPSPAVSVSTARTPAQCISVVGVTTSSSLPTLTTSVPAATGGQSAGLVAAGPVSADVMASKTDNQATHCATESTTARTPAQASRTSSSGAVIDLTEDDDDVQVTGVKKAVRSSSGVAASSSSPLAASAAAASQRTCGPSPVISSPTVQAPPAVRSSPQNQLLLNGPQVTVHYRPQQESHLKKTANAPTPSTQHSLVPPLPPPPIAPARLPPEAAHTSPPQQPQLKLARVQSQNGIVLSWSVVELDHNCAAVDSYHLYAFHQDQSASASSSAQWKKIGEVKALALPMACTLTQFVSGSKYYFAVCARDVYGRFGPFCEPQCTDVITPSSSS